MAREKILIIDDEPEINELIKSYLEKEDFQTSSAYSGNRH